MSWLDLVQSNQFKMALGGASDSGSGGGTGSSISGPGITEPGVSRASPGSVRGGVGGGRSAPGIGVSGGGGRNVGLSDGGGSGGGGGGVTPSVVSRTTSPLDVGSTGELATPSAGVISRTISNVTGGTVNGVGEAPPGPPIGAGGEVNMALTSRGLLIRPSTSPLPNPSAADERQQGGGLAAPTPSPQPAPVPQPPVHEPVPEPPPEPPAGRDPRTRIQLGLARVTQKNLLGL